MASANIKILPAAPFPCYANSFFRITVLVTLTIRGAPWPANATVTLVPGHNAQIVSGDGKAIASLQPGQTEDGFATGSASYWLVIQEQPGGALDVRAEVGGDLSAPGVAQSYSISPSVKVYRDDPDPVLAPVSASDDLTPSETANVLRYPVRVVTRDGQPVAGYPVMWTDALTTSGLALVNAYDGDDASAPIAIMPSAVSGGGLLPLTTDATGACVLCLTPRTQATTFTPRLLARPYAPDLLAQVIVFDPDRPSLLCAEPQLRVTLNQSGQYDFGAINAATVPVNITLNNSLTQGAPYLVSRCNARIYDRQYLPPSSGSGGSQYPLELPKSLVQYSTGTYSPENTIDYVIAANNGNVYTSESNNFYAINGANPYTPPNVTRPLEAPFIMPAASGINIRNSASGLSLAARPSPTVLTLRPDDQVIFTWYVQAWLPSSDGAIPGGDNRAVSRRSVDVSDADAAQNRVVAIFPGDELYGFDSSPATSLPGNFQAEYYVVRAGQADIPANRTYSKLLALPIDTAPPGNWRE